MIGAAIMENRQYSGKALEFRISQGSIQARLQGKTSRPVEAGNILDPREEKLRWNRRDSAFQSRQTLFSPRKRSRYAVNPFSPHRLNSLS